MIIGYYILTHPGICIYGVGRGCVMRVWCQMLFLYTTHSQTLKGIDEL